MPITISHPAAAIPLRRLGLVLSALIVGSMMPDFEFFLRLSDGKSIGHTFQGIFLFSIPVGLLVLFIFHKLIKYPLLSLLPHAHQVKLYPVAQRFRFFPITRFIQIVVSIMVGAISHIVWDAFTHHDGFMAEVFPLLTAPVFILPQGTIRVYYIMQYGGSLVGALLMVYWYLKWFYQAEPVRHLVPHRFHIHKRIGIGISIGAFTCIGGLSYGYFSITDFRSVEMIKTFISHSAIASMSSFMFSLLAFGLLWHYLIPHHRRVKRTRDHNLLQGESMLDPIGQGEHD